MVIIVKFFKLAVIFSLIGVGICLAKVMPRLNKEITQIFNKDKSKTCQNCNVILIDVDILRADALPCYGYARNTAPNICQFAEKSLVFEDNYSQDYFTMTSVFSTFTSLYPAFHKVKYMYAENQLSPDIPNLISTYKKQGYQIALVGNLDNTILLNLKNAHPDENYLHTNQPLEDVVDKLSKDSKPWFIYYYDGSLHMPYLLTEGQKPMADSPIPAGFPITFTEYEGVLNDYLKAHFAKIFKPKAVNKYSSIILDPSKSGSKSVLNLFNALASKDDRTEYLYGRQEFEYDSYLETLDLDNSEHLAFLRLLYDTKIHLADEDLAKVLKLLDSPKLATNTISIIMSDHGEAFGEHGTFAHNQNYHSELFHTPLIMRNPKFLGMRIKSTSSNMDIFPTLLDFTGLDPISSLQGQSLMPQIENPGSSQDRFIMSEMSDAGVLTQNKDWLFYLPNRNWFSDEPVLFHKTTDPNEKINVIEKFPSLAKSLYAQTNLLFSYNKTNLNLILSDKNNQKNQDSTKVKLFQKSGYF